MVCIEVPTNIIIENPEQLLSILEKMKKCAEEGTLALYKSDKPSEKLEKLGDVPDEFKNFDMCAIIKTNVDFYDDPNGEPRTCVIGSNTKKIKEKLVTPLMKQIKENLVNIIGDDIKINITYGVDNTIGHPLIHFTIKINEIFIIHFVQIETEMERIENLLNALTDKHGYGIKEVEIDKLKVKFPKYNEEEKKYDENNEEEKEMDVFFFKKLDHYSDKLRMKIWLILKTETERYLLIGFYNNENKNMKTMFYFGAI